MSFWREIFGQGDATPQRSTKVRSKKLDVEKPTTRTSSVGIGYRLERVKRSSIGLVITTSGLLIRAPKWTPIYEIDAAIAERSEWIETAIEKQRSRLAQLAELRDGGHILFRGVRLKIDVHSGLFESLDLTEKQCVFTSADGKINRARLDDEIKRIAKEELPVIAREMADAAGLPLKKVALSSARTLWGSCTIDGNVRLNYRLVQLPPALMRHIVAHELAHLVEFNHSKRFWAIVESLDPHMKKHRRAVKNYAVLLEL
ncbi:MAG: M48 family metallopeptidase [Casimicrobium sp.]